MRRKECVVLGERQPIRAGPGPGPGFCFSVFLRAHIDYVVSSWFTHHLFLHSPLLVHQLLLLLIQAPEKPSSQIKVRTLTITCIYLSIWLLPVPASPSLGSHHSESYVH